MVIIKKSFIFCLNFFFKKFGKYTWDLLSVSETELRACTKLLQLLSLFLKNIMKIQVTQMKRSILETLSGDRSTTHYYEFTGAAISGNEVLVTPRQTGILSATGIWLPNPC